MYPIRPTGRPRAASPTEFSRPFSAPAPRNSGPGPAPPLTQKRPILPSPPVLALLLAFLAPLAAAADPLALGRRLYLDRCASCHGSDAQGVPGKYDRPLEGDESLSRLTRIIDRTMPDDDPDACVGEDAAAVALYLFESFYSPEARQRRRSARIELSRLTNRQFLTTVADLAGRFHGDAFPPTTSPEAGLRGEYFQGRGFNRDRRVFERLDPNVHLDFGLDSPDPERINPDEFAIRWTGSVVAADTGLHEFAVETPNGARLWINDPSTPLIDAAVASGGLRRHTASLRLLEGRAYPLRLELVRNRNESASVSLLWKPPRGTLQPIPNHRLLPASRPVTLAIATPFPPDDASVGYERGVAISRAWDDATTQAALEAADHVVAHLDTFARTRPQNADRPDRIRAFAAQWVEAAFRRPLDPDERQRTVDAPFLRAANPEDAIRTVVLLSLKSPHFLYLGLHEDPSDPHAVAARLSYALWDSLPDRALLEAARRGALDSREQVRSHAGRMLHDPRTRSKLRHALHHWLDLHHGPHFSKDPDRFPGYSPELEADLRTSLDLFLDDVVWNGSGSFRDLLLRPDLWVNERLATFYNLEPRPGSDWVKTRAANEPRFGVVTHPYLLSVFSYPRDTSPIHRGVFLARNVVGRPLRSPPIAVEFNDAAFDPALSMREKVTELTRPDACWSCHSIINPLGFALEHYDAVGRFRTEEDGRPVDASSEFPGPDDRPVRFQGARDLARYAADSHAAQTAFVEMLFHQVVKQPALAYGPEILTRLRNTFADSHFSVPHLLVEIATLAAWPEVNASASLSTPTATPTHPHTR
ncbi:MAG: DUF1592 domain-containing protein [Verrucomicrobiae bacterium]|nr:DUF1592 domain-containing protein [Verrucomicrobiae bacterium]